MLHGPPPWTGEAQEEISLVHGSAVAADEHRPTSSIDLSATFVFHQDVAREETLARLPRGRALTPFAKPMR